MGVTPDFSDALVIWAYDQQVKVDPSSSSLYFDALKDITADRKTEALETKTVMLESQGQFSKKDLDAAYKHLDIEPGHAAVLTDEHIISQFSARLMDAGAGEQLRLKESLRLLGEARQSEIIKQNLSNSESSQRRSRVNY